MVVLNALFVVFLAVLLVVVLTRSGKLIMRGINWLFDKVEDKLS